MYRPVADSAVAPGVLVVPAGVGACAYAIAAHTAARRRSAFAANTNVGWTHVNCIC